MNTAELPPGYALRFEARREDAPAVAALVEATRFFSAEECRIAVELLEERLTRGGASGYEFLFIDHGATPVAYSCHGRIPGSAHSYDLYWIAVSPAHQRRGLGRRLLAATERDIAERGGRRIYVDTSTRQQYAPSLRFYTRLGYTVAAELPDFYAPGDGKLILLKRVGPPQPSEF